MRIRLKVIQEPRDVSEEKDGSRLLGTIEILGVSHHLEMFRVHETEEDWQKPENEEHQEAYDALQELYCTKAYQTLEVPGFEGRYIAYVVPYEV
jgi:hypothetical protein